MMTIKNKITWLVRSYKELSATELYNLLRLRSEVFVVEQDCVYQDIDGKDDKAIHIMGIYNDELVAYSRVFGPNDYFEKTSIGRVITSDKLRGTGAGHVLIEESIKAVNKYFLEVEIEISAQAHLEKFYNHHGFKAFGEGYLEDGIPHIRMLRSV